MESDDVEELRAALKAALSRECGYKERIQSLEVEVEHLRSATGSAAAADVARNVLRTRSEESWSGKPKKKKRRATGRRASANEATSDLVDDEDGSDEEYDDEYDDDEDEEEEEEESDLDLLDDGEMSVDVRISGEELVAVGLEDGRAHPRHHAKTDPVALSCASEPAVQAERPKTPQSAQSATELTPQSAQSGTNLESKGSSQAAAPSTRRTTRRMSSSTDVNSIVLAKANQKTRKAKARAREAEATAAALQLRIATLEKQLFDLRRRGSAGGGSGMERLPLGASTEVPRSGSGTGQGGTLQLPNFATPRAEGGRISSVSAPSSPRGKGMQQPPDISLLLSPRSGRSNEGGKKFFRKSFKKQKRGSIRGSSNDAPLHQICKEGNIVMLEALLKKSPESVNGQDPVTGYSPLLVALCLGNLEVAKVLLRYGADPNHSAPDGTSSLHALMSVTKPQLDQFHHILTRLHPRDVNCTDHDGETALHRAAFVGNEAGILFLRSKPCNVNARNKRGETALHVAARRGDASMVDLLLSMGADAAIEGDRGTPAAVAKRSGHKNLSSLLKEKAKEGPVKPVVVSNRDNRKMVALTTQKKGESGSLKLDFGGLERLFAARAHSEAAKYCATGSVYLRGLLYLTNSGAIIRHLTMLQAKKSVKSNVRSADHHYIMKLQAAGVNPSRAHNLSDHCEMISCADNTIAVIDQGEVYMSGPSALHHYLLGKSEPDSEQGQGKFNLVEVPFPVKHVAAAAFHTLAVTTNNKVFGWGSNQVMASTLPEKDGLEAGAAGLLGRGKDVVMSGVMELRGFSGESGLLGRDGPPTSLELVPCTHRIVQVACGRGFTLLCDVLAAGSGVLTSLSEFGIMLGFGNNHYGQLGAGKTLPFVIRPTPIAALKNSRVRKIACGLTHSAAIDDKHRLWTWGSNKYGELGHSKSRECVYLPTLLEMTPGGGFNSISCGVCVTAATTKDGQAYTFGRLSSATLATHQYTPLRVDSFNEENIFVSTVDCGPATTAFLIDRVLTDVLQVLTIYCNNDCAYKPSYIREMLTSIPPSMISVVQDRAQCRISEPFTEPIIKIDRNHITFSPKIKTLESMQVFTVSNLTEKRIAVAVTIENSEHYKNSRYSFSFSPENFMLDKKQSQIVKFKMTSNRPPTDEMSYVFAVSACVKKKTETSSVVEGGIRSFIIASILPKNLRLRAAKMAVTPEQKTQHVEQLASYVPLYIRRQLLSYVNFVQTSLEGLQRPRKIVKPGSMTSLPTADAPEPVTRKSTLSASDSRTSAFDVSVSVRTMPQMSRRRACVLFIDVSGFTALNERLARLGPEGPEQVSKHLNAYFGRLIDAVHQHGGDVLKFAGDALICLFCDGRVRQRREATYSRAGSGLMEEDISNSTSSADDYDAEDEMLMNMRAVQCALDIQTNYDKYDSNQGFTLTLHVGVGTGSLYALLVGGVHGSWEFLMVGEPFLQLETCVDASKSGEVVVSPETWELVKNRCKGEPRGRDWLVTAVTEEVEIHASMQPSLPTAVEPRLRCYIPKGVQMRLDSHQSAWLAELRRVTVLFVKLSSLTYECGKPVDHVAVHKVLCFMQLVIFQYEGIVRQFLVDDKGTVLIAAFGVPPLSHEDDALRGLKAAISIHTELKRQKLENSIGITTGLAFCGSVGSTCRQEYAMVGDIVNLAARLMVAAGKQGTGMLCDDATYESAGKRLRFEHLEPITVKGKQHPISIHVPSERERERVTNAMEDDEEDEIDVIGRDSELQTLRKVLDRLVQNRTGSITIIEGEAGMGKSTLLRFVANTLSDLNGGYFSYFAQVVTGCAEAVEKNTPYFMWRDVLLQLLYAEDDDMNLQAKKQQEFVAFLKQECDEEYHPYLPLLNPLLHVQLPESALTKSFSNNQRDIHVANVLLHLVEKRSRLRPLMLTFDNFQFVDPASLRLMYALAKECVSTVAIVIGTRRFPDPIPQVYRNLISMPYANKIKLKPMLPQHTLAVVCARHHLESVPDEVQAIIDKAEGNPFFAAELVRTLREEGVIKVVNGKAEVCEGRGDALKDIPVSETVEAMLMNRVDRLPAGLQMVLKVASVIGKEFQKQTLVAVFPIADEVEEISDHLRSLVSEGIILKKVFSDKRHMKEQKGFFFKSDILQRVVYNRLLYQQRQQLHEAVARHFENLLSSATTEFVDSISTVRRVLHHWGHVLTSRRAIDERPGVIEGVVSHSCFLAARLREDYPDTCQEELDELKEKGNALLDLAGDSCKPELRDRLMRAFRSVCFRVT